MGKVDDIIRRYAEAVESVEGFGPWLLSERDSSEKEEALFRLWDRLEADPVADDAFLRRAKLSALMKRIPREEAVSSGRRWIWTLPVAAALALFFLLPHAEKNHSLQISDHQMAEFVEDAPETVSEEGLAVEMPEPASSLAQVAHSPSSVKVPIQSQSGPAAVAEDRRPGSSTLLDDGVVASEEEPVHETEEERPSAGRSKEASADNPLQDSQDDKATVAAQWAEQERQDRLERQKKKRPFSVGLQSSGGLLAAASSRSIAFSTGQNAESGLGWILGMNQYIGLQAGTELQEKTRYDVPLRVGVSVIFPLNERLSLGTGLTFTLFHSRSSLSSSSSVLQSKDVRYQHLGIPLMLRYQLASGDWGSLYGALGIETAYLLKAWSTVRSSDHELYVTALNAPPLQFSTRLGAGYEYPVYHRWSLFAETSLDYYFKGHSSLDIYYTQHPLSPSVSLGIRYVFGN